MSSSESAPSRTDGERDRTGRFLPNNSVGKRGGNPRVARLAEVQEAIRAAVTPNDVVQVLAALRERALSGDVAAAATWLGRCAGPARQTVEVDLPRIEDASSAATAFQAIVAAVAAGELDVTAASKLADLASRAAEAIAWRELAERVAKLEALRR